MNITLLKTIRSVPWKAIFFLLCAFAAIITCTTVSAADESSDRQDDRPSFRNIEVTYSPAEGIGPEPDVVRRDPSDVIRVEETYYIWYTKVVKSAPAYPEGFGGTLWFATSKDGKKWTEQGEALGRGDLGKFDDFGVFTPNILYAPTTKKYYLYYTGVPGRGADDWEFEKFSGSIGVAVADAPDGGNDGWQRANGGNPVLVPRRNEQAVFDGWHVDDTVMFFRDGKYWLYYKGHSQSRHLAGTGLPDGTTPMGVAVSDRPDGGFERVPYRDQGFLVQPGHELLLWPFKSGICSLPTGHYRPQHDGDFRIHYSADGLTFHVSSNDIPATRQGAGTGLRAPGLYRPDLTGNMAGPTDQLWGISMTTYAKDAGLQRFGIRYAVEELAPRILGPPAVGQTAPEFELKALGGETVSLKQTLKKGPVAVVVLRGYPGYQCPVCTRQVGSLINAADAFEKKQARVILVYPGPANQLGEKAAEFLRDTRLPDNFSLVTDPDYAFTLAYGLRWDAPRETAYPSTFVIGQDGLVDFAIVSEGHRGRAKTNDVLDAIK